MTLAAQDVLRLQKLINSGRRISLAIGWSEDGNEELRFYEGPEGGKLVAKVEAMGGYVSIDTEPTS